MTEERFKYVFGIYPYNNRGQLGFVAAIISAVAVLIPLVISAFKNKSDVWSKWPQQQNQAYVKQGLIAARTMVDQKEAATIDEAMKTIIAQVATKETWEEWKQKNPTETQWIVQAQQAYDNSRNPLKIGSIGGWLLLGLGVTAMGYVIWPKLRFPFSFSDEDEATKKLKTVNLKN